MLRVYPQSRRLALPRFGDRQFPQERPANLSQSQPAGMATACADGGRPTTGDDGARCGADPAAVPDHRGRPGGPNGPIPYFQKEFFHNGYIKSLKQLVHFYNTRDSVPNPNGNTTYAFPVTSGHCPAGTVERVTCWPQPEVPNNIDMTTGALGLTDTEENQIVAFLQTLTDGYNPANPTVSTYKNIDTFTGQCSTTGARSDGIEPG